MQQIFNISQVKSVDFDSDLLQIIPKTAGQNCRHSADRRAKTGGV